MKNIVIIIIILMIAGACSSGPVRPSKEGLEVRVVHKSEVSSCSLIGKIEAKDDSGEEEIAKITMKNETASMGANHAVIKEIVQNGSKIIIHAMAYRCD